MKFKQILVGTLTAGTILTTTLSHAFTPTTNNLVLWLKPSTLSLNNGDPVSLWTDSSASANNASQATANQQGVFATSGINGNPAVLFTDSDGNTNDDWMALATRQTLPAGLTYIAVFSTTNTTTSRAYFGNAANTIIGDDNGAVRNSLGVTDGKVEFNVYDEVGATFFSHQSVGSVANGRGHVVIATLATNGPLNMNLYLNGILEASATRTRGTLGFNSVSAGVTPGGGARDTFDGYIGEVLVYNRVLSAMERQDAYEYLVASFAIPEPSSALLLAAGAVMLWRRSSQ